MNHILDLNNQQTELFSIFKRIHDSNTILFLGAGASVGDKVYLSKQIIELYEQKIGKSLNEPNIKTWIDILSADPLFRRDDFDDFVATLIRKLSVQPEHQIIASIPWREIITTNYDLLIETAFDNISNGIEKTYTLKTIKSIKDLNYKESNTEVKYIKLNGCLQDKKKYPFAFSSDDFSKLKTFYKNVLHELKNLSPEIQFLSVGYSYSDAFGKDLLDKFDSYSYRDKKWMINVDPFPNENALPYYTQNRVCVIKASTSQFFSKYKEWEEQQQRTLVKKRGISISDSRNQYITFPPKLLINLDGVIKQLNTDSGNRERIIKDSDFYRGEEPNFNIVIRNVDVAKTEFLRSSKAKIKEVFETNHSTLVPIFFITGDFGIGKSTTTLRLVYELEKDNELDLIAFEIIDFMKIKKEYIIELVNNCKSKNLVFFCDEVEIESYFKSLLDLQRDLSIEQFQGCNVFFCVPIRENILAKFVLSRTIPRSYELKMKNSFELEEINELLDKLKAAGLVDFRDMSEKIVLRKKIEKEYNSDTFIALMAIITSGKHVNDLIDSFDQLSNEAQSAFLYTALLHKHKILMPASLLKQNISSSWDEFTQKIIKAEGKGLLIQEVKHSYGTQPDLYFRTKHPIIAEKLVDRFLPNKDRQYAFYEKMLKSIEPGLSNSYLANNLLRSFMRNEEYSSVQMNKLYEAGYTKLSDDPHYLLNYSINLQSRQDIGSLKKALDTLLYAESLLNNRNHRFIHRRGAISFDLAKIYHSEAKASRTTYYLNEAKDLFYTKQLLDPFSSYSYRDYINCLIWELKNGSHDSEDEMQKRIQIEDLFDLAKKSVTDGYDRVSLIHAKYSEYVRKISNDCDYVIYLEELRKDANLRPYVCILLYNHFFEFGEEEKSKNLIDEIEYYQSNFEVLKFLLKYYGRNLHDTNIRIKLLKLCRENPSLEKESPLRFNYFNFIAETYNYHFADGKGYLSNIQTKFYNLNPEFHYVWSDTNGSEFFFDAKIVKNTGVKFKAVKIPAMQQTIRLVKGNYELYTPGQDVTVRLHFYLYGLMAEIIIFSKTED